MIDLKCPKCQEDKFFDLVDSTPEKLIWRCLICGEKFETRSIEMKKQLILEATESGWKLIYMDRGQLMGIAVIDSLEQLTQRIHDGDIAEYFMTGNL